MSKLTRSEREQKRIEDAELARRLRVEPVRPLDPEVDDALMEYRFAREKEAREQSRPTPRPIVFCEKHPSWKPVLRLPGQPSPLRSMCPSCETEFAAQSKPERSPAPKGERTAETPAMASSWAQYQASRGIDPVTKMIEEEDAIARIDELREDELRERDQIRPGGLVVAFSSPFAGGHKDAEDRSLYRRRIVTA